MKKTEKIKGRGRPKKDSPLLSNVLRVSVTDGLLAKLKEKAEKERRTVTNAALVCLEEYFETKGEK